MRLSEPPSLGSPFSLPVGGPCRQPLCARPDRLMRTRPNGPNPVGEARLPGPTGMSAHSERVTANGPDGKDCGRGPNEEVGIGMGGGGFAGVTGDVTDEFIAAERKLCEIGPGGDSLAREVLLSRREDSGGDKRTEESGSTKSDD